MTNSDTKPKKTSCGVLILNEFDELLMGHSTGNKFYDIPKGELEAGETPVDCAARECFEEIGLQFSVAQLQDLGLYPYNKEKNLHLFLTHTTKSQIDMSKLVCNSFFEHYYSKKMVPEVDSFSWVPLAKITEHTAKSMGKLLSAIYLDNSLNKPAKPKF